ncbi:hypothetical protein MPDQ_004530 [Monascus purpureus]|uniref:Uncharacterized protein n=1 Tax=Monascus purpureus TaxID=5098 RepID=A0A507QLJ9_MONPU|nr:hypothetical protein MPDQ_004530 [Monascus purpureus]
MTDFRPPMHHGVHRKPLPPTTQHAYSFQVGDAPPFQQPLVRHPSGPSSTAGRTRTSLSSTMPYATAPIYPTKPPLPHTMTTPVNFPPTRRLSSGTTSTSSTGNFGFQGPPSANVDVHRSSSSRSTNAQLGYVALMRRQKATVWCDRAQPEDPRIRAQKLAEKKRAYREINVAGSRVGTHGSGKTKHKDKGTTEFSPSTLVSGAVPVRLSANEVGDDADDEIPMDGNLPHRRTGSGRSSQSGRFPSGYQRPNPGPTSISGTPPPNEKTDLPGVSEKQEHEQEAKNESHSRFDDDDNSIGSEPEESFGTVGDMAAPRAALTAVQKAKRADELRRSGSVDDRTTSLTGVRLFVANPDLSD